VDSLRCQPQLRYSDPRTAAVDEEKMLVRVSEYNESVIRSLENG
jgi:hypothetical protein